EAPLGNCPGGGDVQVGEPHRHAVGFEYQQMFAGVRRSALEPGGMLLQADFVRCVHEAPNLGMIAPGQHPRQVVRPHPAHAIAVADFAIHERSFIKSATRPAPAPSHTRLAISLAACKTRMSENSARMPGRRWAMSCGPPISRTAPASPRARALGC